MNVTTGLVFLSATLAAWSVTEVAVASAPGLSRRLPGAARRAAGLVELVVRAGTEGRDPGAADRRRLIAAGAVAAFALGAVVAGAVTALIAAATGPWAVGRLLRARRERYRRAVSSAAAPIAVGIADALGGGHSVRGAIVEASEGVAGPAGRELRRVAAELQLGASTEDALEAMRDRAGSPSIDTIVAGMLLQRRAGGDLARLLRDCARAFEDQARLDGEVRTATAQARFTGLIVVLLPLGGALLAELASPGYLRSLADGFLTAWLVGLAVVMQGIAALMIRRLGRVRG